MHCCFIGDIIFRAIIICLAGVDQQPAYPTAAFTIFASSLQTLSSCARRNCQAALEQARAWSKELEQRPPDLGAYAQIKMRHMNMEKSKEELYKVNPVWTQCGSWLQLLERGSFACIDFINLSICPVSSERMLLIPSMETTWGWFKVSAFLVLWNA